MKVKFPIETVEKCIKEYVKSQDMDWRGFIYDGVIKCKQDIKKIFFQKKLKKVETKTKNGFKKKDN